MLEISFPEDVSDPAFPAMRPGFERDDILGAEIALMQGDGGRMLKRAQHRGDIRQGKMLAPSFADRSMRFPVQINNDNVLAGVENLFEMIIAVATNLFRNDF